VKQETLYFKLDDASKLRMIAHWMQSKSPDREMEIENDLRRIADMLEEKMAIIKMLEDEIQKRCNRSVFDRFCDLILDIFCRKKKEVQ